MRTLIVSGFLAKDAQIDTIPTSGNKVLKLVLASNEYGDEKNADGTNKAVWVNISSFKEEAMRMAQYLKKGSNIIAIGDMRTRMYQNKAQEWVCGVEIYNADIKFNGTGTKKEDNASTDETPVPAPKSTAKHTDMNIAVQPAPSTQNDDTDDLPF
jgi:single stranded DNA-binding protein